MKSQLYKIAMSYFMLLHYPHHFNGLENIYGTDQGVQHFTWTTGKCIFSILQRRSLKPRELKLASVFSLSYISVPHLILLKTRNNIPNCHHTYTQLDGMKRVSRACQTFMFSSGKWKSQSKDPLPIRFYQFAELSFIYLKRWDLKPLGS